jgi:hypothetical protein
MMLPLVFGGFLFALKRGKKGAKG